ncbi:putative anti-sigma-YlaC factor YlaD [Salirhabdus euzebyi]|uniref:Putative anti-sigma-YlaC factor YlaD n=1 Tax=Salirhabdus euzebyi TaxID=394506 RepID=A0A841QAZ2_9BACI|nr:hypothetical protein [Salirhabdus euzebyi]MBB6455372.1 putative anti-sigma-YlaC factor YlaD [Salirhabdus euzebyi]
MGYHFKESDFEKYVNDSLRLDEKEAIEDHLTECDECFAQYMAVMEDWSIPYTTTESFTDDVIAQIEMMQPSMSRKTKSISPKEQRRKTVYHYFLAAGLTIILMFSGVFQFMFNLSEQIELDKEPISEQLLNGASGILLTDTDREGEDNE